MLQFVFELVFFSCIIIYVFTLFAAVLANNNDDWTERAKSWYFSQNHTNQFAIALIVKMRMKMFLLQ